MIDPHVHLRDWEQRSKETLKHGFLVAQKAGIYALFEMPNTQPVLTRRETIVQRLEDADRVIATLKTPIFHGVYGGVTRNMDQVRSMVDLWRELFPRVVGLKYFAGHSTGNMGVVEKEVQNTLFTTLVECGFTGVLAIHCEEESCIRGDRWDPNHPETHSQVRPPVAEITSVAAQLEQAERAGFQGSIHICHISTVEAVALVEQYRRSNPPFSITTGVTPHHLLLWEKLQSYTTGNELKMNPPLRSRETQEELLRHFLMGDVDWIESDHAPHTLEDKKKGASGIPGIPGYRLLIDYLITQGIPLEFIKEKTEQRVIDVFGLADEPRFMDVYQMAKGALGSLDNPPLGGYTPYQELADEYPFDGFSVLPPETWL